MTCVWKTILCLMGVLATSVFAQENLLKHGGAEDAADVKAWGGHTRLYTEDAHSGEACFHLPHIGSVSAPGHVEIDPTKTYELSGWFRSLNPKQPSRMLLDIRFLDADQAPIKPRSIHPFSGVSTLVAGVAEGAQEVTVAAGDWPLKGTLLALVFNAREDLSDLPNHEFARVKALRKAEDGCAVELTKPLPQSYPAGTSVRLHRYLDYPRVVTNAVPTEWTRFAFRVAAEPVPGGRKNDYFWPGARYMEIKIIHHYTHYPKPLPEGEETPELLFDDITLKEIGGTE